jgi:dipeptidyl aminopeptidase/acylaminoacyl peptidase
VKQALTTFSRRNRAPIVEEWRRKRRMRRRCWRPFFCPIAAALAILAMVQPLIALAAAPLLRPITVEDCVRTRRVVEGEVSLSPDGTRVAYVVKAPNLRTDRNDYLLYVRQLGDTGSRENGSLLLRADRISELRWVGEQTIAALVSQERQKGASQSKIVFLNATTGEESSPDFPLAVENYSASADGAIIVFSVRESHGAAAAAREKTGDLYGYPVSFGSDAAGSVGRMESDELVLATRSKAGPYSLRTLHFRLSRQAPDRSALNNVQGLELSPDGKFLLINYSELSLPPGWRDQPFVRLTRGYGTFFYTYVLGLYDIATGQLRSGFNFPGGFLHARWSDDSRSYAVTGPSPFGSRWSALEMLAATRSGDAERFMNGVQDVYVVDRKTREAEPVLQRYGESFWEDLPIGWRRAGGPMLLRARSNSFAWMTLENGRWKKASTFRLLKTSDFLSSLDGNGRAIVGTYQTAVTPPDVFAFDLGTKKWSLLTDLNPEYRGIELGSVEKLAWTNRYGSRCAGFLIKPPRYRPGVRYPMVFLSAPARDVFISDAAYTTAYAPQPLADAGFIVVMSQYPLDNRVPRGMFPGQMSDAYNWMAMVESAVDLLDRRGVIDRDRVGIGGFSRTSWLTDFTLTHSAFHFAAASSADGGIYTYGAYFTYNSAAEMRASETQMGGPPYGNSFRYWWKYAPPFNAARVRTPVLMEYTRTAEHGFEFFTALSRLGKLVQFYRYPQGKHPLDSPWERVASLQRNVDWFRFWMEGYEGSAPAYDPMQYARWRAMREMSHGKLPRQQAP